MGISTSQKNVIILAVIVIAVIVASFFSSAIWPDSLKSQDRLLKELKNNPSSANLNEVYSTNDLITTQQEKKDISSEVVLYCEWSWPQKIINKATKEVLWTCSPSKGYCKPGTSQCCEYEASTKTYFNCVEMNK